MSKNLIQLIKNSKLVIITGSIGSGHLKKLLIELRENVDLTIRTKGIKKRWWFGWEKYLQLEVCRNYLNYYNYEIVNLPLAKQDFTRLDAYSKQQSTEYRQTITEQRN